MEKVQSIHLINISLIYMEANHIPKLKYSKV